jgi:hypothetical protein
VHWAWPSHVQWLTAPRSLCTLPNAPWTCARSTTATGTLCCCKHRKVNLIPHMIISCRNTCRDSERLPVDKVFLKAPKSYWVRATPRFLGAGLLSRTCNPCQSLGRLWGPIGILERIWT